MENKYVSYILIYIHSPHNMVEYGVHILPTLCNIRTPVCMYVCVCVFSVFRIDNETSTQATLAPYMNQFYRCQDVHCKQVLNVGLSNNKGLICAQNLYECCSRA